MPTSKKVTDLKINKLTEAQYKAAVLAGVIDEDQLSLITDETEGQVKTFPVASADYEGQILQYVGVTDSTYTNGYFYKCTAQGTSPETYAWVRTNTQPAGSTYTAGNGIDITGGVISTIAPTVIESGVSSGATGSHSIFGGTVTDEYSTVVGHSGSASGEYAVAVGAWATALGHYTTVVGAGASATYKSVAFGRLCVASGTYSTAIGFNCTASGDYSVQLGGNQSGVTNSDANTVKYSNENGNFEIVSADGTIPADRLKNAINKYSTMPTASASNVGWIVQFTGTTDSTYTHGHLYECVSDGQDPATYSWEEVQLGSGGSSYTAGTGISITNNEVSVADPVLVNDTTQTDSLSVGGTVTGIHSVLIGTGTTSATRDSVVIGYNADAASGSVVIGSGASSVFSTVTGPHIAIGYNAKTTGALQKIQLGPGTNSDANTFKVANQNGNFEIMSADGTIPAARHAALPSADGTYVLKLVIANGVPTLSWVAE